MKTMSTSNTSQHLTQKDKRLLRIISISEKLGIEARAVEKYLDNTRESKIQKLREAYIRYAKDSYTDEDTKLLSNFYVKCSITSNMGELWMVVFASEFFCQDMPDPDEVKMLQDILEKATKEQLRKYQ